MFITKEARPVVAQIPPEIVDKIIDYNKWFEEARMRTKREMYRKLLERKWKFSWELFLRLPAVKNI